MCDIVCMHVFFSNCKELSEDFCSTVITSTHYATGTLEVNADPNNLNDEINQINGLIEFDLCGELLKTLNCIFRYPACSNETENVIPICQSQCLEIDVRIKQCLLNLQNNNLTSTDFPLVEGILSSVECKEPSTYYDFWRRYIEENSTNCVMLSTYVT